MSTRLLDMKGAGSLGCTVGRAGRGGVVITERQVFAALPRSGFLRSYVEWAGKWLEANVAFHVSSGLALLSQSVPVGMGFQAVTTLRANFYGLLVGPSSASAKTRSIETAKSVLQEANPESIMIAPGSPEACIDALNGRPQILFYDEFGSFLQGTEGGQLAPLRMVLTDLYDCGMAGRMLVKQRGKKAKRPEANPRLSILGGVTPGLLEAFTTEVDWSEGFLARFFTLYASAERQLSFRRFDAEGMAERTRLAQMLAEFGNTNDPFSDGPPQACRGFTLEAAARWDAWCLDLKKRAKKGDHAVKAAIHRAQGHAIKAGLLLSWDFGNARSGEPWDIDMDALEPAIAFTELHITSVEEIAQGLAPDRDMRDERRMFLAIDDEPIAYGDALLKARLTKRRGDEMISSLVEKGLITRLQSDAMEDPIRYIRKRGANVIQLFPPKQIGAVESDPF